MQFLQVQFVREVSLKLQEQKRDVSPLNPKDGKMFFSFKMRTDNCSQFTNERARVLIWKRLRS